MTELSHDWLAERALRSPDKPALLCSDGCWTYRELHDQATETAKALRQAGLRPGDRVALLAGNSAAYVRAVHAGPRVGATLVPLNVRLTPPELAQQLALVEPRLILADRSYLDRATDLAAPISADVRGLESLAAGATGAPSAAPAEISADAIHSIIFTSGTTGRAKGTMLSHGNFQASAVASALSLGVRSDDRWLVCLPLFHVGGLSILIRSAINGTAVVLHDGFDAREANRAIDDDGVTIVSVVSVMLQRMLDARDGRPYPPSFRCALLGGGPAPEPLLREAAGLGVPVAQTYGLTEAASQVATLPPEEASLRLGSAGRPLWGTRLRIVRDGGEAAADEAGEIIVQGPTVTPGYFRDPAATEAAIRDGWLHTGDIGRVDADGYLYVLDRRDDLIVSGGENVYPAEIEAALIAHPGVAEAGVAGLPDAEWGARPVAVVVLKPGGRTSAADLLAFAAERLASYKRPRSIRIVDALPRTAAGKLQRHRLPELFDAGQ